MGLFYARGMDAQKHGQTVPISDELRRQHEEIEASMARWAAMTDEELAREGQRIAEEMRAERLRVRANAPAMTDVVGGIAKHFGWSREYVRHLAQPYCECESEQYDGGWRYCDHAHDLGYDQ